MVNLKNKNNNNTAYFYARGFYQNERITLYAYGLMGINTQQSSLEITNTSAETLLNIVKMTGLPGWFDMNTNNMFSRAPKTVKIIPDSEAKNLKVTQQTSDSSEAEQILQALRQKDFKSVQEEDPDAKLAMQIYKLLQTPEYKDVYDMLKNAANKIQEKKIRENTLEKSLLGQVFQLVKKEK